MKNSQKISILILIISFSTGCELMNMMDHSSMIDPTERGLSYVASAIFLHAIMGLFR